MRTDLYTKGVLTVIAAALVWLSVSRAATPVSAQGDGVQRVTIVGWDKPLRGLPVVLVNTDGQNVLDGDMLRTVIGNHEGQPIPVSVTSIGQGAGGRWEAVPVVVAKGPPARLPGE